VSRVDHPDAVAAWPRCPRQWDHLREWGWDALPLAELLRWEVERGTHRKDLPAGAARLLREYLVLADLPQRLHEARQIAEARAQARKG